MKKTATVLSAALSFILPSSVFAQTLTNGTLTAPAGSAGAAGASAGALNASGGGLQLSAPRLTLTPGAGLPSVQGPTVKRQVLAAPAAKTAPVAAAPILQSVLPAASAAVPAKAASEQAAPSANQQLQETGQIIEQQAKAEPSALRRAFSRLFDGGKAKGAAPSPVEGSLSSAKSGLARSGGEQYLASSPQIPLPEVIPVWRKAQGPQQKDAAARYQTGQPEVLASEGDWTFMEDLQVEDAAR